MGGCLDHYGIICSCSRSHPHHLRRHLSSSSSFIFSVTSVIHYLKRTGYPLPHLCCYFTGDNTWLFRLLGNPNKFQIPTRKSMTIVPAHECKTRLVLTAMPELNTCTIESVKMMIVPNHPSTICCIKWGTMFDELSASLTVLAAPKKCTTSFALHKPWNDLWRAELIINP